MVMTEAEVNADACLGDVVEIQLQLGGKGGALTVRRVCEGGYA